MTVGAITDAATEAALVSPTMAKMALNSLMHEMKKKETGKNLQSVTTISTFKVSRIMARNNTSIFY